MIIMATIKRACEKCRTEFTIDIEKMHRIDGMLCDKCWQKWLIFFEDNHKELDKKYPNLVNSAWSVFTNQLPKQTFIFR